MERSCTLCQDRALSSSVRRKKGSIGRLGERLSLPLWFGGRPRLQTKSKSAGRGVCPLSGGEALCGRQQRLGRAHVLPGRPGHRAGDEVIVPGYTFIASISSDHPLPRHPRARRGQRVSLTIDPADVERKITDRTRPFCRFICSATPAIWTPLWPSPKSTDLLSLKTAARRRALPTREESRHLWGHRRLFPSTFSRPITAGDGGMVLTNSDEAL